MIRKVCAAPHELWDEIFIMFREDAGCSSVSKLCVLSTKTIVVRVKGGSQRV